MAYLMSDAAAGSNAAMTLMQNMGAAPLATDVGRAQAEQSIATAEKSKLANLIAETGFKQDQESKLKLQQLIASPEFASASDSEKQSKIGSTLIEAGKVEDGFKALTASELTAGREIANQQKQQDLIAQQIGSAYSVLSAVPEERIAETWDKLPEATKKAVEDKVGKENFARFTPEEKVEATKNLMVNASKKTAAAQRILEAEKQEYIRDRMVETAQIRERGLNARRLAGGSGSAAEDRNWSRYEVRVEKLQARNDRELKALDKQIETAEQAAAASTHWYSMSDTKEEKKYKELVKQRDKMLKENIQEEIDLTLEAPDFPGKKRALERLNQSLTALGDDEEPKGKGKIDTSNIDPKTQLPKGGAPKEQGSKTQPMPMPASAKEAVDGKYYNTSKGVLKWDAKSKQFVE